MSNSNIQYKFNVGDKVKVVKYGVGVHSDGLGKVVTIKARGYRSFSDGPGYAIDGAEGFSHNREATICETSFELVERAPVPAVGYSVTVNETSSLITVNKPLSADVVAKIVGLIGA